MGNQKYEAFLKVAEAGSFKQAAHDLGYTQAGMSYLVGTLERELFVRDYGGARPTSDGEDLLPGQTIIAERQLKRACHQHAKRRRARGRVHQHVINGSGTKTFLALHPGIDLQLICLDDEDELEAAVWRGDADCGFLVYPIKRDLEAVPLRRDPLLVVLPPNHPLASAPAVPRRALAEEPYIRLKSGTLSEMEALFRRNNVEPNALHHRQHYAVMSMVTPGWASCAAGAHPARRRSPWPWCRPKWRRAAR
ncbi:MAG: LysR family transcriptional regulator [Eggerthellaceae bacterium]